MIGPVSRPAVFSALASAPKYRTPLLWVSHLGSSKIDSSQTGHSQSLGVAFSISAKFGNAVERNRARRRLRSAFRSAVASGAPADGAVLVRCNRKVLTAPHAQLVDAAKSVLEMANSKVSS